MNSLGTTYWANLNAICGTLSKQLIVTRLSSVLYVATYGVLCFALASSQFASAAALTSHHLNHRAEPQCRSTSVVILGAGVAGITAAQALSNQSITDFLIVETQDYIGGRVKHVAFGKKPDGTKYNVELGANWVQGLDNGGGSGPENPIWTLAKRYNVSNTYSNYSSILTYDDSGYFDYSDVLDEFEDAWEIAAENADNILKSNLQDYSTRAGFSMAGWKPKKDMLKQAVEWWEWDWETSYSPEQSGFEFGITGYNDTFDVDSGGFGEDNNFVWDQRGFNTFVIGEANTFLKSNDSRLFLNTTVENITYSDSGVTIYNDDGSCISADYAICTFSVGVLQNDVVSFEPPLPDWKQLAIEQFQMGTYTKIFLQFNETFWDRDTQFFLYADPDTRGYFPVWQSLSAPGFIPESNIIFVTVVEGESWRIEQQEDEVTKKEVLDVLQTMFPNITIPEPIDFMYPRWSTEKWAFGSYSNWPVGMTLERHQNLRANVDRLWFAGEANSAEYYGFLHGAWYEGRDVGSRIAGLLGEQCLNMASDGDTTGACGVMQSYEVLHGTTEENEFNPTNGWFVSSTVSNETVEG